MCLDLAKQITPRRIARIIRIILHSRPNPSVCRVFCMCPSVRAYGTSITINQPCDMAHSSNTYSFRQPKTKDEMRTRNGPCAVCCELSGVCVVTSFRCVGRSVCKVCIQHNHPSMSSVVSRTRQSFDSRIRHPTLRKVNEAFGVARALPARITRKRIDMR